MKYVYCLIALALSISTVAMAHYNDMASSECSSYCGTFNAKDYAVVLVPVTPIASELDPYIPGYYICSSLLMGGIQLNGGDSHDRMTVSEHQTTPLVTQASDDCVSGAGNPLFNAGQTFYEHKLKFTDHPGNLPTFKLNGFVDNNEGPTCDADKFNQLTTEGDACKIGSQLYCVVCGCTY